MSKVIRFPPYIDTRVELLGKRSLWSRIRAWLFPPSKAQVFRFKNPTQWKLERIRRKARGAL